MVYVVSVVASRDVRFLGHLSVNELIETAYIEKFVDYTFRSNLILLTNIKNICFVCQSAIIYHTTNNVLINRSFDWYHLPLE